MTREEYLYLLRIDFAAFIERSVGEFDPEARYIAGRYLELIAAKLEACRRGQIKRSIITLPPRSLKSHIVSVAFPAWLLGHDPTKQIIAVSYAQDFRTNTLGTVA